MNKLEYLEKLEYYLKEKYFERDEIDEILEDYSFTIDEALDNNISEEALEEHLGNPKEIVNNMRKVMVIKRVKKNKFVALSPFISVILFFILGFGFDYWEYGWLVFLLIPMSGILSSRKHRKLTILVEIMPFISLSIFLTFGLIYDVWHPTWIIFLLIPATSIIDTKDRYKWLSFAIFIIGPLLYLSSYFYFPFDYNWFFLLLMIFPAIYSGLISIRINGVRNRKYEIIYGCLLALLAFIFVVFGSIYGIWHPLWLIFLLIPVFAIVFSSKTFNEKLNIVALSPFIAVVLFVLVGEFFSAYQWSWLFFLLIPVSGILSHRGKNKKISWVALSPFIAVTMFFLAGELLNGYQWSWLFFLLIPMTAIISD
ncbi:hypothetical protein KHQ88_05585 [Mycoplasmatota bacterium]|nr:hypothetical protein KHQ88_05585 [Mycoplasmatota bacterium]